MTSDMTSIELPAAEFLQNLVDSGLSNVEDAQTAAAGISAPSGWGVAERLVAAGVLTTYQAEAVLKRRFADLRMGNYDILSRLGAGAMGTVFKARHRRMKRVVALKVLSKNVASSDMFAQRFQREVEMIARLSHPNIVMAFDADEAEDGPFLVMEFVDGRDLSSDVAQGGPFSIADAVDSILQAGRGLECAHVQGIIHRDIKPGNLLRDAAGVIKVADLGLARLTGPGGEPGANYSLTQAGGVVGTLDYMAPEQALDSTAVDARVDIYSLGCTLHFLLTAQPPYQAGSIMALLLKHREAEIPSLGAARPDVPREVDAVFRRMVAKSPADRYSTMTDAVRALEQLQQTVTLDKTRPTKGQPSLGAALASQETTIVLESSAAGKTGDTGPNQSSASTGVFVPAADRRKVSVAGRKVVLVEPSRTQAGIIRRYLQQLGIEVIQSTSSGREALELAKRERVEAIFSSMHLSDMTGAQLAHDLLADPGCNSIGFVLATSEADADATAAVPQSPRVVLMPKPFDLQRLERAIGAVVG